jgi:sugar lactone lactonase YvrE
MNRRGERITMEQNAGRYESNPVVAPGWRLARVIGPSCLYGSNGMRFGPDGLLYVAQCFGNEITAFDTASGARKTINRNGGPVKAPDDLAFDSRGLLYVTEFLNARVMTMTPGGRAEVLIDNVPGANGITIYRDRIFMDECRPDAQVVELFRDGRAPKVLAEGLELANALAVGPDEKLYFPQLGKGEVCRVPLDGGPLERVVDGLAVPTAVKFDNRGALLVLQAVTGEISRVDIQTRQMSRAAMLAPGLDNLVITPEDRLYVSNFIDGTITEVMPGGAQKNFSPPGMSGPSGITCANDGTVYLSDFMAILKVAGAGRWERIGWSFDADFPGFIRSLCAGPGDLLYATTMLGNLTAYDVRKHACAVIASGLETPFGVARTPSGALMAAEYDGGRVIEVEAGGKPRVLARGLEHPAGLAVAADGSCFAAETGKHRVVRINGGVTSVLEGLGRPEGLAVAGDQLIVLDAGSKQLWTVSLRDGKSQVLASGLPVGFPMGASPQPLVGVAGFLPGPILPFAGVATGPDGTIYIAADGEGSVIAMRQE